MNRPLFIIFSTIVLDSIGIGIVFPLLPSLLKTLSQQQNVALLMGFFISCYAMMQFIFSPILGSLSDKIGRRPILLISLAGSTISYLLLAFSSHLSWLFIGRIIAGMTSANMAVASAYIVDISSTENRAKYFGRFNAMFGLGFIIGPVLGGLLGQYGLQLPFLIAALLTGLNFLIALFALAESRPQHAAIQNHASLNPFKIFKCVFTQRNLLPLLLIFFIFSACGEAYGVCWALWGHDTFHWNSFWVGLSLGTFGLCQVLVQSLLPQHAVKFWGERNTILIGLGCIFVALNIMAFAQQGWIIFVIMPIFALGSIGTPSLQALASAKVSADLQGQFQGLIASTVSLASVIAPLFFSSIYFHFHTQWSGAIWLIVAIIYLFVLPLILFQLKAKPL
ncbi:TCR/Tet family MFS transporter [Acinetobacter bereziniae]|uniref:TCR/Tet family MFS transporter n=1 Tax=Acinetobacter bereziniae TaxID=106648 RepID=UPI0012509782|nr:TCR/Tet family MFS transporter [Acinetobacter bereziniae]